MQTFAVEVLCVACGEMERIYVEPMDYIRWVGGIHAQDAFPYLDADERDALISNMCLDCIDEMYRDMEEEEDYEDEEAFYTAMELLDPESDSPEYERDWYVD